MPPDMIGALFIFISFTAGNNGYYSILQST